MIILIALVAVVLVALVGCLYLTPMHSERPGTNREALGTIDSVDTTNNNTILIQEE